MQSEELNLNFDTIIIPNGSGGTHTGLLTGLKIARVDEPNIKSYTVLASLEKAMAVTHEKVEATLNIIDNDISVNKDDIDKDDSCLGTSYGVPTNLHSQKNSTYLSDCKLKRDAGLLCSFEFVVYNALVHDCIAYSITCIYRGYRHRLSSYLYLVW